MTIDPKQLLPLADEATALLKALSHPARLRICCQLRQGELSVGQIESLLDIRQPRLSRELAKLREEGLVETRRESKAVFYRLASDTRITAMVDAVCTALLGRPLPPRAEAGSHIQRPNPAGGYGVFARTGSDL